MIKAIYGAIFDHLVNKINDSVAGDVRENTIRQKEKRGDKASSVGILVSRNPVFHFLVSFCPKTPLLKMVLMT